MTSTSTVNRNIFTAVIGVGVVSILLLAYRNKKFISRLLCSPEKQLAFARLDNIELAELVLKDNLKFVEGIHKIYKTDIESYNGIGDLKKKLSTISSDLDFVLSTLDGITGDEDIKAARRAMVERFKIYAQQVDIMMADVASNEASNESEAACP